MLLIKIDARARQPRRVCHTEQVTTNTLSPMANIMSTVLKTITATQYLARERKADFKSEYFQGEVFAMAGGSPSHSLIGANVVRATGNQLDGKTCRVFNSDLRIKVQASGLYTYPDASIVCGELQFDDEQQDTVTNPTVIVEVLSDSTEKYDRGRKSAHYRTIDSVQVILLIAQDARHVECYTRQAEDAWLLREYLSLEDAVNLDGIGISLSMSEIYRGVEFKPDE